MLVAAVAVWIVFTPDKLTPIVRSQASKYLTCKSDIGDVELTFFSTFPLFGLKVNNVVLINPVKGAASDTLLRVGSLIGVVDVGAWWKRKDIVLNGLQLQNGTINAFIDTAGRTNFNIVRTDSATITSPDTTKSSSLGLIDIKNVEIKNVSISYVDLKGKLQANIQKLSARFSGSINNAENINSRIKVSNCIVSFSLGDQRFLNNVSLTCDIPVKVNLSRQLINLNNAAVSVNDMSIVMNGTIENDTLNKQILTNVNYRIKSWSIPTLVALVPPAFQSYLNGIKIDGIFHRMVKLPESIPIW